MLDRLPAGISLFIDTNVFLYHVFGTHPSCTRVFARIQRRELRGYTSPTVLTEVLHKLMLAEVGERYPIMPAGALRTLRRHPEIIATLTKGAELIRQFPTWRIRIVPVRWHHVQTAMDLARRHHLMTTDALILATIRASRLIHLATNDTDFLRVPNLTVWRP